MHGRIQVGVLIPRNAETIAHVFQEIGRRLLPKKGYSGYISPIWWRWAACFVTQVTTQSEALQRTDGSCQKVRSEKLTDKGFGFIALSGGKDIFFHSSNLEGVQYEDLHEGQKVSFVEGRGPKGPRAEQVKPV